MRWGWLCALAPALMFAEAGVLIPSGKTQPDAAVLSLDDMDVRVVIDNGHARVESRQIFANHTGTILEGTYTFALPSRALISDFAVWDDVTRIPGVILERRRAEEVYQNARMQAIDPGLLQAGEREPEEAKRSAVFTAKIVPIPAYGTKRLEMEYQERLSVQQLQSQFALPLRPDMYRGYSAAHMHVSVELRSTMPLKDFEVTSKAYPVQVREKTANRVLLEFDARNVAFTEDFAFAYSLDAARIGLDIITHRELTSEPGFFEAAAIIPPASGATSSGPRTIIALFDVSLSMQWEKLERNYLALERLLHSLRSVDQFNLILFHSELTRFSESPVKAEPGAIDKALQFVKTSRLRGGTALQAALEAGLQQSGPDPYIVLMSDGEATRGLQLRNARIAERYAALWNAKPAAQRPRTYIWAVGDDANLALLKMLAKNNGVLEWVRSTEPAEFKLDSFLAKIGRRPIDGLRLTAAPALDMVYPLEPAVFPGSVAAWVGQYKAPGRTTMTIPPLNLKAAVNLPVQETGHPQLPLTWAKARVDALLQQIERHGEDSAAIDEIIRLSRKYKFVTPYTSFLAAPRALLRPRVIRPGDPVLRVRTDASIASVVAMFPFGLVKPLRYLKEEDIWQTRFLAPADLPDGSHTVRLVMRDKDGRVYRESKSFVIVSKPPEVKVRLDKARYKPGDTVLVRALASASSRTVMARMHGVDTVSLRWNAQAQASTGTLTIPGRLPAGRYALVVTAEDFAHNIGSQEVSLEVVP